ncbi:unnamed protein product [[Candida] boidinii]|nr:unnamed protein product [[Candida] boidinii]
MVNILPTNVAPPLPPQIPIINSSFAPNQHHSHMEASYINNSQQPQYHQHLPYNLPQQIPNQEIPQGIHIPVPQSHAAHQHLQNLPQHLPQNLAQDSQPQPHLLYQHNLPVNQDQAHMSRVPMGDGSQIPFQPMGAGNIQIPQSGIELNPNIHVPYTSQPVGPVPILDPRFQHVPQQHIPLQQIPGGLPTRPAPFVVQHTHNDGRQSDIETGMYEINTSDLFKELEGTLIAAMSNNISLTDIARSFVE